jgi:hypothetical protein
MRWLLVCVCVAQLGCEKSENEGAAAHARRVRPFRFESCTDTQPDIGSFRAKWIVSRTAEDGDPDDPISVTAISVEPGGSIWTADKFSNRVRRFDSNGKILAEWGEGGDGPGEFRNIAGVAHSPGGDLYVGEAKGRITVFSENGSLRKSFYAKGVAAISDLIVLRNGNLVVTSDVMSERLRTPYAVLMDSSGNLIRSILSVEGEYGKRPFLGHEYNMVQLGNEADGVFSVWYPMDNYVDLVPVSGERAVSVVGCLPKNILASYNRQRLEGRQSQSLLPLTKGVRIFDKEDVRIVSLHEMGGHRAIRIRRFTAGNVETEVVDYNISTLPPLNRVEMLNDSTLLAYHTDLRESGLIRIRLYGSLSKNKAE